MAQRERLGTVALIATAIALIGSELASHGVARAWAEHPMTSAVVSGAVLLLLTVFVVDEVLKKREDRRLNLIMGALASALIDELRRIGTSVNNQVVFIVAAQTDERLDEAGRISRQGVLRKEGLSLVRDFRRFLIDLTPTLMVREDGRSCLEAANAYASVLQHQMTHAGRGDEPEVREKADAAQARAFAATRSLKAGLPATSS